MKEKENKVPLLTRWKNKKQQKPAVPAISQAPNDKPIPLSYGQQQLWFLQQLYPDNPFYNYTEAYKLKGILDIDKFNKAVERVVLDHTIFSSSYHVIDEEIYQRTNTIAVQIPFVDLSDLSNNELDLKLKKITTSNTTQTFDLQQAPLFALHLIKITEDEHLFLITMHHIITDKWSMDIFRKSLSVYYDQLSTIRRIESVRPIIQYFDYAYWQKNQNLDESQIEYWSHKLKGSPSFLDIPLDYPRPSKPKFKGALHTKKYSSTISKQILSLATKLETTPYILLLSVYNILLYRYTGQCDILIGSPISNRNDKVLENLIGFFNDTVVLRNSLNANMDFSSVHKSVKADVLASFSNKDIPFDTLVKKLKPERTSNVNPFFQVMFLYHSVPETPSFGSKLFLEHELMDIGVAKFDLTLYVSEDKGILSTTFEYATDVFREETIFRLQDYYYNLLEEILENPNKKITQLRIEKEKEISLNKIKVKNDIDVLWSNAQGIHELIENQAKNNPEAIALSFKDEELSNADLNNRAQQVALKLITHTTERNQIVGLCLPRSIELIVGVLGILKAGCAYLPLDPEYPLERSEFMLADTEAEIMVTNNELSTKFKETKINKIRVDEIKDETNTKSIKLPKVEKQDLAYIIYTSGSTGIPKGVPISHENILSSTLGRLEFYEDNPSSFLLLSSIAFDSSKAGLFWTLCTGGKLVVSEDKLEQDVERLCKVISEKQVSHTLLLPSLYYVILQFANIQLLKTLKTVIVAGEACTTEMVNKHFEELPKVNLYNEYGPTEATVWCIAHKISKKDVTGTIPIGRPVSGSQIILLDDRMNIMPKGAIGEIYVGGPGLSNGYLKRPELTANSFLTNPNTDKEGKLYKTGDLARYNADGNLEFLGRKDHQVKIRGHRIELEEIKNIAVQQDNITEAEACVVTVNNINQIYLYVSLMDTTLASNLQSILAKKLPKYMIPSRIITLANFPKLPNGKNDLGELVKIEVKHTAELARNTKNKPVTEIQEKLLEVWGNVLKQPNIGINDNFFEVGGDSILSIQIISGARKMGLSFSPNDLFEHQTIAELERLIINSNTEFKNEYSAYTGPIPLSPIQKWFFETHKKAPHYWNQAFEIEYTSSKEVSTVKKAYEYIIQNHDALRTRFYTNGEQVNAEIISYNNFFGFETFELSQKDQIANDEHVNSVIKNIQQQIDLEKSSLFKCLYFQNHQLNNYKIVLLAHHLVIDVVSWQIVLDDFKSALDTNTFENSVRTTSIKDWHEYLIEISTSKEILAELDFWQAQNAKYKLPVDLNDELPLIEASVKTESYILDQEHTQTLTTIANEAYNTKTDELLLAAFSTALCQFTNSNEVSIALEKHGRETLKTNFDLSNTVGWFTSFFPIKIHNSLNRTYAKDITELKETLRNVPNGGIGFGILKHHTTKLNAINYPEVVFNFLGTKTETEFNFLTKGVRHSSSERYYFLEANLHLEQQKMIMRLSYSTENYNVETIQNLMALFDKVLKEILEHCTSVQGKFTPSDFPELDMDQNDLDDLLDSIDF